MNAEWMTQEQSDTLTAIRYSYKGSTTVKIRPDGSWVSPAEQVQEGDVVAKWCVDGYRVRES